MGSGFLIEKECSFTGINFFKKQRSQMNTKSITVSTKAGEMRTTLSLQSLMTSGMRIGSRYFL